MRPSITVSDSRTCLCPKPLGGLNYRTKNWVDLSKPRGLQSVLHGNLRYLRPVHSISDKMSWDKPKVAVKEAVRPTGLLQIGLSV